MLIAMSFGLISRAHSAYHPDPNNIYEFCKARVYFGQSATMTYRWCLAMACIDRYASSSVNVRAREFSRLYIAYRVLLIIAIIWIILPVHNLIFHTIDGGLCVWSPVTVAINNLKYKRKRRQNNCNAVSETAADRIVRVRDRQTLIMLFIQTIFYIILTIPWTTFLVYSAFTSNLNNKTSDRKSIESFAQYLTETLAYTYSTLSFYLYTLTSPTFRRELIKTIYSVSKCEIPWYDRHQRIEPN
ncbi:hypothetical protein I4U23_022631 [Adineta vaga]|nr:hypothetical protein I4U23_022631 [Adineta vaga]